MRSNHSVNPILTSTVCLLPIWLEPASERWDEASRISQGARLMPKKKMTILFVENVSNGSYVWRGQIELAG